MLIVAMPARIETVTERLACLSARSYLTASVALVVEFFVEELSAAKLNFPSVVVPTAFAWNCVFSADAVSVSGSMFSVDAASASVLGSVLSADVAVVPVGWLVRAGTVQHFWTAFPAAPDDSAGLTSLVTQQA